MILQDRAVELINSLGRSPQEIAAKLRKLGIKGRRGDAFSCPVELYLRRNGMGNTRVYQRHLVLYIPPEVEPPGGRLMLPHPEAVRAFIVAFDQGAYPDLLWSLS